MRFPLPPQVVDVGCGIGGPLRAISAFSGASVMGVNNNEYQARSVGRLLRRAHQKSPAQRRALGFSAARLYEESAQMGAARPSSTHARACRGIALRRRGARALAR